MAAWQPKVWAALEQGLQLPAMPEYPTGTETGSMHTPCVRHNAMIAPLAGETLAGVLWYQGVIGFRQYVNYAMSCCSSSGA